MTNLFNQKKLQRLFLGLGFFSLCFFSRPAFAEDWSEFGSVSACSDLGENPADLSGADATSSEGHTGCFQTPSKYQITLYKLGICTSDPFGEDASVSVSPDNKCTWTMDTPAGTAVDLGAALNTPIGLPTASENPSPGTYTHMMIVMGNQITVNGSIVTQGGTYYTKPNSDPTDSAGLFDKDLTSAQDFTHEFTTYGFNIRDECKYHYQRTITGEGVVRGVIANSNLVTQTTCSDPTRIVGVFNPENEKLQSFE